MREKPAREEPEGLIYQMYGQRPWRRGAEREPERLIHHTHGHRP